MATPPFHYEPMFQKGPDTTEYYLLTKDYVSVSEFEGKPILKVAKEGLTAMANAAFRDVSFMLRRSHNEQVAKILSDPEATDNDKYVALTFLRNAEVAAKGVLPFCQDTGTAIIHGEKGQQVWTGYCDEEALSLGVYKTYTEENLRYSQNAPLNMYDEVNTKCNLPAQIDIEATEGMEYEFLCVTKGGGSANKTYLYQETKAILNPGTLVPFLVEKIKTLGTAAWLLPVSMIACLRPVARVAVLSATWSWRKRYWPPPRILAWALNSVVNIWHMMFASSVCLAMALLAR